MKLRTVYQVQVPDPRGCKEFIDIATFDTKAEAIQAAIELYGADKNGKISLIEPFEIEEE